MPQMTLLDVTHFGADPSGRRDSAPAVRGALARAREIGGSVVVDFPTGRYELWPEGAETRELYVSNTVGADPRFREKTIALLVDGVTDLLIRGNGSTLVLHGRQTAIAVIDSARVDVVDLTVDHAVPTVVDATVVAAGIDTGVGTAAGGGAGGERPFRVLSVPRTNPYRVEGRSIRWHGERSPVTGEEYWSGADALEYTQVHDPAARRTFRAGNELFSDVEAVTDLGAGLIRIDYAPGPEPRDIGLVYQMRLTTRDHPGILVLQSEDVRVERLRVHFLHGLGIVVQLSENFTLRSAVFRAPRGTGRSSAGFADFVHLSGVAGDVVIQDCVFDGPHDDPINIHGTYLPVVGRPADDTLELAYAHPETAGFPQFFAGDEIEIVDAGTLLPVASGLIVAEVAGPSGRDHERDLHRMVVRCTEPLPPGVGSGGAGPGFAVENLTYTPRVRISGCHFLNVPTRGILASTRGPVLIEGNRFEGVSMASVFVSGDATEWFESGPVRDLTIRDNVFLRPSGPAVLVAPHARTVDPERPVHQGVTIEENTFVADDVTLLDVRGTGGLRVERNRVHRLTPSVPRTEPFLRTEHSPGARVSGNRFDGARLTREGGDQA
jgi:hypothetical protein